MICYKYCFNSLFRNICMIFSRIAKAMSGGNLFSIPCRPQPGIGRGRERDGIAMREGCGKGAGIHLHFPHSRYFLSRRKQSLHCYPIINYFFHSFAEASRKVKNNINVRRKCTVWHCNAIKHFFQFLMMRFQCGYLGLQ